MTTQSSSHHIFILMGVSGSGKSVVANQVSHQLNTAFLDGDFLHPRTNIMKMAEAPAGRQRSSAVATGAQ